MVAVELLIFHLLKSYIIALHQNKFILKCDKDQSELTAFSTVLDVEKMFKDSNPNGIYYSHRLHDPKQFMNSSTSNKSIAVH